MIPSPREQRRGTRRLFYGGAVVALILLAAVVVWPLLPNSGNPQTSPPTAATGTRSNQGEGESQVAKSTRPTPETDARATTEGGDSGKRARQISESASNSVQLSPEQRQAVADYVKQQGAQTDRVNFTLSVGAAVPRDVKLQDMPRELAEALPAYRDDQYLVVNNQVVVVEKQSRRIVALIPTS